MKDMKSIVLGTVIASAGILAVGTETTQASEVNSVATIKAEMHKQQGNKQHLAVYRVQKGDTLSGIAEASGLTIAKILDMNDILNPNLIHVGQLINLGYSQQANQFVSHQGQSVAKNQKQYTAPTSMRAQKAMNATKSFGSQKQARVSSQPTNQYRLSHQAVVNNSKPANGQWNNTPSGANSNVSQKPVVNNGKPANGQWGGSPSSSKPNVSQPSAQKPVVNNGKPANGQWGGSPSSSKPNSSQSNTKKPVVNNGKPANGQWGGSQSSSKPSTGSNQQSSQDLNAQQVNKAYQQSLSNDYGWKGQWMTSKKGFDKANADWGDYKNGYAETSGGKGALTNKTAGQHMAHATDSSKENNQYQNYKYGYSNTKVKNDKLGSSAHTDYYFWN